MAKNNDRFDMKKFGIHSKSVCSEKNGLTEKSMSSLSPGDVFLLPNQDNEKAIVLNVGSDEYSNFYIEYSFFQEDKINRLTWATPESSFVWLTK